MIYFIITYLHLFILKLKSNIIYFISFIILICLAGLRYLSVGTDTAAYYRHYQMVLAGGRSYKELLWDQLLIGSSNLNFSFTGVLFFASFLTLFPVFYVIKKRSIYPFLSLFLYLSLYYYFYSFNIMRQMIATSWILLFYYFYEKNNKLVFITCLLIACFFHKSAILVPVTMVLIYILQKNIFYKARFIILFCSFCVGFFFKNIFYSSISIIYPEHIEGFEDISILSSILKILTLNMFFILIDSFYKKKNLWYWVFYIYIIITNLLIRIPLGNRITYLFGVVQIVLLADVIGEPSSKSNKIIFLSIIIVYATAIFLSKFGSGNILPYLTIF